MLDSKFLEILACPSCKTELREDGDALVCASCGRRYPVRHGIPILLLDETRPPKPRAQEPKA